MPNLFFKSHFGAPSSPMTPDVEPHATYTVKSFRSAHFRVAFFPYLCLLISQSSMMIRLTKPLLFISLFVIPFTVSVAQEQVKIITPNELEALLDESLLLIDVRTKVEFDQGYIPGAVQLNFFSKEFEQAMEQYDRYRPVYLYCRTGHRSMDAAAKLISMGFREVYSLEGGMMRWLRFRKPVAY